MKRFGFFLPGRWWGLFGQWALHDWMAEVNGLMILLIKVLEFCLFSPKLLWKEGFLTKFAPEGAPCFGEGDMLKKLNIKSNISQKQDLIYPKYCQIARSIFYLMLGIDFWMFRAGSVTKPFTAGVIVTLGTESDGVEFTFDLLNLDIRFPKSKQN